VTGTGAGTGAATTNIAALTLDWEQQAEIFQYRIADHAAVASLGSPGCGRASKPNAEVSSTGHASKEKRCLTFLPCIPSELVPGADIKKNPEPDEVGSSGISSPGKKKATTGGDSPPPPLV
jgi:hypothetical protein